MSYSNPIQDHNDRVAHSTSWDEHPDVNETEFVRGDFYIPEDVKVTCFQGHDITEESCVVCGRSVSEILQEDSILAFGCLTQRHKKIDNFGAQYYEEELKGHICMECYEDLPDGDGQ